MLSNGMKRGFSPERLRRFKEPKVRKDEGGYYIHTVNENAKVYFDDYYKFLKSTEKRCLLEKEKLEKKISGCDPEKLETVAYYRARNVIVEFVLKIVYSYYGNGHNFSVIMSPWCLGTVMLEKLESYKEILAGGEIESPDLSDNPYYVLRYLHEIYRKALMELLDLPEKAFKVKWQYTELLKRYSRLLCNVIGGLETLLLFVKGSGSA
ncbi:MAG: hypothetical protein AMJ90_04495 [candidate division Zixibacteria bacterium SM23_73_2]|nr:MAG: hypothetical protein AMJ90_04495 [candidate division Zixibacteria bacterium SM23_73_2]